MQQVFRAIGRLARSAVTVLITGESGTGKELVARALHEHSPRAGRPFIALNTAAIPADLLESELFGHERGAFTGADAQRRGRFEQADGGTLFLDEIGDMSMPLQTRLLRVLAEGEFYRVGGQTPIRVDVRVIAATHQNLEERVATGLFREDLYHRLNVIRIELPPLRARAEDIPDLLTHYMRIAAHELGVEPKVLAAEALERLAAHEWPGNVRELVNLCRRLSVLAPGSEVHLADLPPELAGRRRHAAAMPTGRSRSRAGPSVTLLQRHAAAARCGATAVRARADPRSAQAHPGTPPGGGEAPRLGAQHPHPQAEGARHERRHRAATNSRPAAKAVRFAPVRRAQR